MKKSLSLLDVIGTTFLTAAILAVVLGFVFSNGNLIAHFNF